MTVANLVSASSIFTVVVVLLILGALPVFVTRLAALLYPKGHPRRAELVAEMAYVRSVAEVPRRLLWLGGTVALAMCEGIPARVRARPRLSGYLWFKLATNVPMALVGVGLVVYGATTGGWYLFPPGGPDLAMLGMTAVWLVYLLDALAMLRRELRQHKSS